MDKLFNLNELLSPNKYLANANEHLTEAFSNILINKGMRLEFTIYLNEDKKSDELIRVPVYFDEDVPLTTMLIYLSIINIFPVERVHFHIITEENLATYFDSDELMEFVYSKHLQTYVNETLNGDSSYAGT